MSLSEVTESALPGRRAFRTLDHSTFLSSRARTGIGIGRARSQLFAIMLSARSCGVVLAGSLMVAALGVATALGQTTSKPRRSAATGTRTQLEAEARAADSLHRPEEAFQLHSRLENGDFDVGDVIIVQYEGLGLTQRDSLVVRAGRILPLPDPMGDLNLTGILRSELADSVTARVAKYYRNEVVHVHPMLRLSISGAVPRPGFYYEAADAPLSDVIMRTGGQDQLSDLRNVKILRGDQVLWSADDVQAALGDGLTVQGLDLQPGDEIVIGAKRQTPWLAIASVLGSVVGLGVSLFTIMRR